MKHILLIIAASLALAACGKKGGLIPPEPKEAALTKDIHAPL